MKTLRPDWLTRPEIAAVAAAFEKENLPLRFVGGAVRDALLGREVSDVDAATPVKPELVMALLEKHGLKVVPTGLAHGTVTAILGEHKVEVTTLRRDVETDGRHAVVAFTDDWREDAARRDFTINAMFLTPDGRLFDYFDGERDLSEGRVRFIGNAAERIAEDRLRVLRFFRFVASHGTPPADSEALGACEAASLELVHLSGERIRSEMVKFLSANDPGYAVEMAHRSGVLAAVLGGALDTELFVRLLRQGGSGRVRPAWPVRLAALLLGSGDPKVATDYVVRRWKFSNREADLLRALTGPVLPDSLSMEARARVEIYRHGQPEAFWRACLRAASDPARRDEKEAAWKLIGWQAPRFPVSGGDLAARGMVPGIGMGEALKRLEAVWIASDFTMDKAQLLADLKPGS